MQKITSLCKRRGFVYPTSEIYGGLVSSYDYGPLGAELLRNIRNLWWKKFISDRPDMVGIDSQIMLNPKTWEASGHLTSFKEVVVEDKKNNKRYRLDHLLENWISTQKKEEFKDFVVEELSLEEMWEFVKKHQIKSPNGNEISEPKQFDVLFPTKIGVLEESSSTVYLRGETAQGIFTNFKNILDSTRQTLPFGVGQIGKSFRNEITSGQFIFRTLEFEQAEIEYFFDPEQSDWKELLEQWKNEMLDFVTKDLGISEKNLKWRKHTDKERSHYSEDTYDLDYKFPFGFKELWGVAYRTNYDLKAHIKYSGQKLEYRDPKTNKVLVPHVIEPAVGLNRIFFMVLNDAYTEEGGRAYLNLSAKLAPYKVAVFPLVSNKENIVQKAKEVYNAFKIEMPTYWDGRGNIGKRYMYQDEVGTPFCITIDYETLEDESVTIRDRDSMVQERVNIPDLKDWIVNKIKNYK